MDHLALYQYGLIGLIFVWSGFVRTGLGFGGAVLALPFLLLIVNDPLVFLPLIAVHLIIFSSWIMGKSHYRMRQAQKGGAAETALLGGINWAYLRKVLPYMMVPKIAGVIGLITFPPKVMTVFIFTIVVVYSIGYIINRPIGSKNKIVEGFMLGLGSYISGASLTGAPLIIPVFAAHVPKHQLRDTLFVLWFLLTVIKLTSLIIAGINLQLIHHLWLIPCVMVGHVLGEKFHRRLIAAETTQFFRILGCILLLVSGAGVWQVFWG